MGNGKGRAEGTPNASTWLHEAVRDANSTAMKTTGPSNDEQAHEIAETGSVASSARSDPGLVDFASESPFATAALGLSIITGAIIGYAFIGEDLSATRRALGGALAGDDCWLLVMFGRVIQIVDHERS